jgi:predicted TIM-barrel fold metal-dependent hydrolase
MHRRDFLTGGLAAAAGHGVASNGAFAQAANPQGPFTSPQQPRIIDAHCHMFNVLDVPAENFIKKVVLPNVVQSMGAGNRDYADLFQNPKYKGSIQVMLHLLAIAVTRRACDPTDEIAELDEMENAGKRPRSFKEVEINLLIDILNEVWWSTKIQQGMRASDVFVSFYALNQIKYLLRKEAFPGKREDELRGLAEDEAADCGYAAGELYNNRDGVFAQAIRWGLLFTRYRFQLAEELQRLHGGRAKLLTPALVDFGAWFGPSGGTNADHTVPMRRQTEVMARIARHKNGPRVHGFVGFDPLRQALFTEHGGPKPDEPMAVVKSAILDNGFIGVKLYPPMGFRPTGNAELGGDFPKHVKDVREGLGPAPGAKLDAALDGLYAWCAQNDVPIMAHTSNSYGSSTNYGLRAGPAGWVKVLAKYPALRLNMSHFGGFNRGGDQTHPERSWGWTIGGMFGAKATPHVYADISFFSEVLPRSGKLREYVVWLLQKFAGQFPDASQHIIYGTDWTMVGFANSFPSRATPDHLHDTLYPDLVVNFLRNDLKFSPEQIDAVMFKNAVRFMGLGQDQKARGTRGRLEQFYLRAGLSTAWMQEFDQA